MSSDHGDVHGPSDPSNRNNGGAGDAEAGHTDPEAIARLERQGGSKLKRKMIQRFLGNTPGKLAESRAALEANDDVLFRRSMHKLRSTTLLLGALRMSTLCIEGEMMARDKQHDEGREVLDGLDLEFQRIRPWFEGLLEDPSA